MRTTIRNPKIVLAAAALTVLLANAFAGNVRIIANPSIRVEAISDSEIKSIFLEGRNSLHDGTHVEAVLAKGGPAHQAFLRDYLGKNDDALQTYYRSLVFTGRGVMPKILNSDAEIVAYVAKTRGAIGYVSPDSNSEGVRTLAVVNAGSNSERKLVSRVEPDYPTVLRARAIGGTVKLRVTVAASGSVQDVVVLGGDAALGEAAATAVSKWKYAAAPSKTTTEVTINFNPNR